MMKTSITVIVIFSLMVLLPSLHAAPSTYRGAVSAAASDLLAKLQEMYETEKQSAVVDREKALIQGGGFESKGCYKDILDINPDLRRFHNQYSKDFDIEIVCAHPVSECTRVALKEPGQHLKYVELCKKSGYLCRREPGTGGGKLEFGSCWGGYSGTVRTIIPVGSGSSMPVLSDVSYKASGGKLTCLAVENFNVPTCPGYEVEEQQEETTALIQGGGFESRGCYKDILDINPDLRRFHDQYSKDFDIEIVCAHPVPECTRVALKEPGQHLKYVELCKKSGYLCRREPGTGGGKLEFGSCWGGYSGTVRTIIPVGSGSSMPVLSDVSYKASGGKLTCLAVENFNVPTCPGY